MTVSNSGGNCQPVVCLARTRGRRVLLRRHGKADSIPAALSVSYL
jgi:hypothetical protein